MAPPQRTITFFLLFQAFLLAACGEGGRPPAKSADEAFHQQRQTVMSTLTPCDRSSTQPMAQLAAQAGCLVIEVPLDPAVPDGETLDIRVMHIPAIAPQPEPDPLVIIVGGPGQAATEAGLPIARVLNRVRQRRDLLLVDQRGTGRLSPFDCQFSSQDEVLDAEIPFLLERQRELLESCLDSLDVDPGLFTTSEAVADLEAVRRHFGYSGLNLWGGSYGTRVALRYMQLYPETTRSVVLDGAAPPAIRLPLYLARDGSAALERVMELCNADAECAAAFPELETHYQALLARLEESPQVSWRNFRTLETHELALSRDLFAAMLRAVLYSREAIRLLPLMIEQVYEGDYQPLAAILPEENPVNQGMFLSVICSEDMRRVSSADLEQSIQENALLASELLARPLAEACETWPTGEVPEDFFEPVTSSVPVLILSGELDPVTPPRWGEEVAETLSNSRHLVVPGLAHITTPYGCMPRLISGFIESADPAALEADCLDHLGPRPFFLNPGGSAAPDD